MYSSSDRGRSPASYWTSSSLDDAFTRRSSLMDGGTGDPQPTHSLQHPAQDVPQRRLERRVGSFLQNGIDRLLDGRALVPEVGERGEQVVAQRVAGRRIGVAGGCRTG